MNLTDIISEAPNKSDKNMVPMGGGGAPDLTGKTPFVAGNPADDADKSAIPQDTQQDADKQIDAQDIAKLRPAIKILMPKKVIEVIDTKDSNLTILIFIPNLEIISDKGSIFVAE